MKILIFSDIHGDLRAIGRVMAQSADLYIDAGDLATFGKGLDRCGEMLKPLGERLWVLPGNHETHDDTRAMCQRFGFVDFHRQVRALESAKGSIQWAGLGYSNITPFKTPGEYSEDEIARGSCGVRRNPAALSGGAFSAARHEARRIRSGPARRQSGPARMGGARATRVPLLRPHP